MKMFQHWSKETFQKVFITTMFTLSAVYGTFYYYVLKQVHLLGETKAKYALAQQQIEEAEKMAAEAKQDRPNREKVEAFVAEHRQGMITGDPFAWVVREVSMLVEAHPAIIFRGVQPGSKGSLALKNRYSTFEIHLAVTGGHDQIGEFVRDLENRFATARIQKLNLVGNPDGAHQAEIDLSLLIVPEPKTILSNAAAAPAKSAS